MGLKQTIALTDFAPDLDPLTPGIIQDADGFYPTTDGYATLPSLAAAAAALPSACMGAWSGLVGANIITVLATANQLYMLQNGTLVSQALTLTNTANYWSFDVFGTDLIATNGVDPVQVSSNGATFTALGGSPPTSSIAAATDYSLFLIKVDSNTWISSPNDTNWTTNIATQVVSASLSSTHGNITAAKSLRSGIVIYKQGAIHVGQFGGPPFFWTFAIASDYTGTPGARSVISLGDLHYFVGVDDFYTFDGYSIQRLQNNVRQWFFANLDQNYATRIAGRHDQTRALLFWHFPSTAASPAGTLDTWVCYSLRTGKWAKGSLNIDLPLEGNIPAQGAMTYSQFGTNYGTYSGIPAVPYDSPIFGASAVSNPGVVDTTHTLQLYSAAFVSATGAFLTTFDLGDRRNVYQLRRARVAFKSYPTDSNGNLAVYTAYNSGVTPTLTTTATLSPDGWFNLNVAGRVQRLQLKVFANAEVIGYDELDLQYAGQV